MSSSEDAVSARRSPRKRTAVSRYSASELVQEERPAKRARVSKSTTKTKEKEKNESKPNVERRPHAQSQSAFLNLPAEIVDMILGDPVLSAREHLALSGTCTALRLGYDDGVWKVMTSFIYIHHPHSIGHAFSFETALLQDPCSARASRVLLPSSSDSTSRIWSTALSRFTSSSSAESVDFTTRKCLRARDKSAKTYHRTGGCGCIRWMGPNHAKVARDVNRLSVTWYEVETSYRTLFNLVQRTQFRSTTNRKCRRMGVMGPQLFCLAAVDAAILREVGGVWSAERVLREDREKEEEAKREEEARKKRRCQCAGCRRSVEV